MEADEMIDHDHAREGGPAVRTVALTALLALTLAFGAGACGSSDNDDNGDGGSQGSQANADAGGAAGADPASDARPAGGGGDEAQINAVYKTFVDAFYDGDGQTACAQLTAKAAKDFGKQNKTSCKARVEAGTDDLAPERPFIARLRVQGDRALAHAGTKNTAKYPVPLTKTSQGWKISGGF